MVRISDIAREMNLSEATVSNAFTGKGRMKEETREAILSCAESMGYKVRPRKNTVRSGKIIIIAEAVNAGFVTSMLTGIYEEASRLKLTLPVYSLQITDSAQLRNPDVSFLNQSVSALLARIDYEVSGILYLSQYARRTEGLLDHIDIPFVSAFCRRDDGKPFVHYDDHQGAYLAVNTLLAEGRRKIAMISGPIDSIGMYLRSSGYQQALVEHRLSYDPRLVRIGDWDWQSGYEQTLKLLKEDSINDTDTGVNPKKIDAIFAQNDFIGLGAARAVREMGLRIPEDISIIGFDSSLPSQLSSPTLTTIQPPFEEMGRVALRRLMKIIDGQTRGSESAAANTEDGNTLLPCSLRKGESTLP